MHTLPYNRITAIIPQDDSTYVINHALGSSTTIKRHKHLVDQATWRGLMMRFEGMLPPKLTPERWEDVLRCIIKGKIKVNP